MSPVLTARPALIRDAVPADAAGCAEILADWLEATPWMPKLHSRAETAAFLDRQIAQAEVILAVQASSVAGFAILQGACLAALYTKAPGQGHGRALLDAVKTRRTDGFYLWCFQANLGAQRFYRREGLCQTRRTEGENAEGLPDIRFAWGLR
ncbi:MAG: N-acetyltransferase [Pseudomonadota bacterium]